MPASLSTRWSNASRRRTSVSTRSTATAVADLAAPSSSASSPKNPPGPTTVRIAGSLPSSGVTRILTDPLDDDEQGVAWIAAVEDGLAAPEPTRAQGADHEVEPRLVQAGE